MEDTIKLNSFLSEYHPEKRMMFIEILARLYINKKYIEQSKTNEVVYFKNRRDNVRAIKVLTDIDFSAPNIEKDIINFVFLRNHYSKVYGEEVKNLDDETLISKAEGKGISFLP